MTDNHLTIETITMIAEEGIAGALAKELAQVEYMKGDIYG